MKPIEPSANEPAFTEKAVTIPPGHDTLLVQARGHTWVSVLRGPYEIVRDHSKNPVVDFNRVQTVWLRAWHVHAASGSWVGVLLRI